MREYDTEIVTRYKAGESAVDIAKALGVTKGTVYNVIRRTGAGTKRVMGKLTTADEDVIVARYKAGETVQAISKDFEQVHFATLHNVLKRRGIATREDVARVPRIKDDIRDQIVAMSVSGKTAPEVASHFGISVESVQKFIRLRREAGDVIEITKGRPKIYDVKDDAFDTLTPEALYWAGFLFADGCIYGNRLIVCLASVDVGHLEKLKLFLNSTYPIRHTKSVSSYNRDSTFVWFSPRSNQITETLRAHGIVAKRTRVPAPQLAASPDFWRGAVDGDGWLGMGERAAYMGLSGQALLLESFQGFLSVNSLSHQNYTPTESGIFRLQFDDRQAEQTLRALYSNACVALDRKNVRAQAILSGNYNKSVLYKELAARQRVTDALLEEALNEED
jgi:transposase